jgi:hypothetical protein
MFGKSGQRGFPPDNAIFPVISGLAAPLDEPLEPPMPLLAKPLLP